MFENSHKMMKKALLYQHIHHHQEGIKRCFDSTVRLITLTFHNFPKSRDEATKTSLQVFYIHAKFQYTTFNFIPIAIVKYQQ